MCVAITPCNLLTECLSCLQVTMRAVRFAGLDADILPGPSQGTPTVFSKALARVPSFRSLHALAMLRHLTPLSAFATYAKGSNNTKRHIG